MSLFRIFQRQNTPAQTPLRATPAAPASPGLSRDALARMDWSSFEQLVDIYLQSLGIRTEPLDANDRTGFAIKLFDPQCEEPYALVKCLARSSHDQDLAIMESFHQVKDALQVPNGMVVVNIPCSAELHASAKAMGMKLLDLDDFWAQIMKSNAGQLRLLRNFVSENDVFSQRCPHCALLLRERVARTGQRFLACPNFPRCNYTPLKALTNSAQPSLMV